VIVFHLDGNSGVPTYRQLVVQVERALQLGRLRPGDRVPAVREVVEHLAINPNTVFKAYRELELKGLVSGRRGEGTFIQADAARRVAVVPAEALAELQQRLAAWLELARSSGLGEREIEALIADALRPGEESAA
jgi:GntR family transcriptional regulator